MIMYRYCYIHQLLITYHDLLKVVITEYVLLLLSIVTIDYVSLL